MIKVVEKKPGVLKSKSLAQISSKKGIDIQFYFHWFKNSMGLAIIQDFTAHWAIKNEEMVNVWKFYSVRMKDLVIKDSGVSLNFKIIIICLYFPIQVAVKS